MTIFERATGIIANRLFSFSEDPERKNEETIEKWKSNRRLGIGATDISAIVGLNPWKSQIDVYMDKKGLTKDRSNEKMRWGSILEEPIAEEFSKREGVKIQRVNAILQHKEIPYILTSLDRIILIGKGNKNNNGNGVLEIKTTGWGQAWEGGDIPEHYFIQLQWELHITGLKWGKFATLIGGQELLITQEIKANEKMGKKLEMQAVKFWKENIEKNIIPEPSSAADLESVKKIWDKDNGTTIEFEPDFERVLSTRKSCSSQIKELEEKKKILDAQILNKLGNNKYGNVGEYKVTKIIKEGRTVTQEKLKEKYIEIYNELAVNTKSVYAIIKKK